MASISDVAKEAKVSVATVSYVLSKKKYVSEELTERVWMAVEKLGYKPNRLASGLRNRETKEIGVVLQNIKNIFFVQLLSGLETKLQEYGYSLIFYDTNYDIKKEKEAILSLKNRWVDGIILYSCIDEKDKSEYSKFLELNISEKEIPIVSIDRTFETENIAYISAENKKGAFEATKHLILNGKSQIIHITGRIGWEISLLRQKGYIDAMQHYGFSNNINMKNGKFRPIDGYEICKEMLSQNQSFDGVFAANDQMAIGCIKAIKEMGIKIPDDIAVVGYDNIFVSTMIEPSLTTVNVPRYAMGVEAARLLVELINEKSQNKCILDTNLIIRQSSDIRGERNWELYGW